MVLLGSPKEDFFMKSVLFSVGIVLLAACLRLLPHPANVAPIAAMALFGGAYLDKRYALVLPIAAMLVSDMFLGFHPMMPFVYGSFLLTGGIGMWLSSHKHPVTIFAASLVSSLLFFLITNVGVWLVGGLYPKTFAGLETCFIYALPFFRNTILGDLFYTGIFFGAGELFILHSSRVAHVKALRK